MKKHSIYIPHLRYTVLVMDMSKLRGVEIKGCGFTAKVNDDTSCIFLEKMEENIKKPEFMPYIYHEAMHVIQHLCERFSMKVENEQEHLAYLQQYLVSEITASVSTKE